MKCRKHKIEKKLDMGGVMFCRKCMEEGCDRITPFLIFEELKNMSRYKQVDGKLGFIFTYQDYLKLRKKFIKTSQKQRSKK